MHEAPGARAAGAGVGHESGPSPVAFFVLVFALAVPFWVVGGAPGLQLMPGLPIAGLMFVCPGLAALILAFREGGSARAGALAKRLFDFRRLGSIVLLAPILLFEPL